MVQGSRWVGTGDWVRTDTENARDKIPMFLSVIDAFDYIPNSHETVAVEMVDDAESIVSFKHPDNATYLFGPEDGKLSEDIIDSCKYKIKIPTAYSLNLAACVACIGHDRMLKEAMKPKAEKPSCPKCGNYNLKIVRDSAAHWHCNACGHEWNLNLGLPIRYLASSLERRFTTVS
jgi:ribosomal protein L37AE/L43A